MLTRMRGLMGRPSLEPGEGMLIRRTGSIHTFFMRFPIDLVFLDRGGKIARIMPNVKPWRLTAPVFGARSALELEAGAAAHNLSHAGDEVSFEELA